MGGCGSGRSRRGAKRKRGLLSLDLKDFTPSASLRTGAFGTLKWTRADKDIAAINYRVLKDKVHFQWQVTKDGYSKQFEKHVAFDFTPQHLGGQRRWFICPHCHGRCRVLFLNRDIACRKCWRLVYDSQYERFPVGPLNRNNRNRHRLGGKAGFATRFPPKPKGMRWRTYYKLCDYDSYALNHFARNVTTLKQSMRR